MRDAPARRVDAAEALRAAGIEPVELREKEGLALINGTDGMLGMLVLAIADLRDLLATADIAAAMSVEGLLGTDRVFAADLQALRPQPGQAAGARPTCARCSPAQPDRRHATAARRTRACRTPTRCAARRRSHGAARDTLDARRAGRRARAGRARSTTRSSRWTAASSPTATSTARPSATCSTSSRSPPPTSRAWPSAAPTASSTVAAATACRRSWPTTRASTPGYMIAQYTQAAIVSELKRLAVPASVDSIPSAPRCRRTTSRWAGPPRASCAASIDGLTRVLAIELLTAARGIDLRAPLRARRRRPPPSSPRCASTRPGPGPDRFLAPEIAAAVDLVATAAAVAPPNPSTGPLA